MKKEEAVLLISNNLQKHENIFRGYAKGSINLKCACDNLATYLLKDVEQIIVSAISWDEDEDIDFDEMIAEMKKDRLK